MFLSRATIIDCGANRTTLGVFTIKRGRLRLERLATEQFPSAASGVEQWLELTGNALRIWGARLKASGPVLLVLPPHLVLAKLIKIPQVTPAQQKRLIRFEAEQGIPYALTAVVWDWVTAGAGTDGLDVLLAAAKTDRVESLCTVAREAGFQADFILPAPLATLACFRLVQIKPALPALVLNLGCRTTTLLLVSAGRFAVRTMAIGTDNPRLVPDLVPEVVRTLLYFCQQNQWESPVSIQLTGDSISGDELVAALRTKLGIPVARLDLTGAIQAPGRHELHPELTDLMGAAAVKLLPAQPGINLLPPAGRRRSQSRRRQPWLFAAAVLLVGALLPPVIYYRRLAAGASRDAVLIERDLAPLRVRHEHNRANLEKLAELQQQIASWRTLQANRGAWLNLLAELQRNLDQTKDMWLEKMAVVSATDEPLQLAISGCLFDRSSAPGKATSAGFIRVKAFLASLTGSSQVAAVVGERFDATQPGILRFDFVLVTDPWTG